MPTLRRPGTGMSTCIPRIPRSYRGLRDVLIFKVIGLRSPFWKVLFECSPIDAHYRVPVGRPLHNYLFNIFDS